MKLFIVFLLTIYETRAYFTVPGKCPENVNLQDDFKLSEFYGKWYQAYHYSSDGKNLNKCANVELMTENDGIYLNLSRIDRGLFHRFSIGKLLIPSKVEDASNLEVSFFHPNAPRRLATRTYSFRILATNYNYYATVYTCQYSSLIDKHYIYIWILSRNMILNDVSKELATKALQSLGISDNALVKDSEQCEPKYYENIPLEPLTFNYPVPLTDYEKSRRVFRGHK